MGSGQELEVSSVTLQDGMSDGIIVLLRKQGGGNRYFFGLGGS